MTAPFAAIETATATTAVAALANVDATISASTVSGVFDDGYAEAFGLSAGSKPTFLCNAADLPSITLGTTEITINAVDYTIVEQQPDGMGLVTLMLESQ